jgi:hypothetical protein
MESKALTKWKTDRADELDQIASAHAQVGGSAPGRRRTTQQINHAYAVLLSSHVQGFFRDLHSEAVAHLVFSLPSHLQSLVQVELTRDRLLDKGNPNPGNLGKDFQRLALDLWSQLYTHDAGNEDRNKKLDALMTWRNAIAHQDFDPIKLGTRAAPRKAPLRLQEVRTWRTSCNRLVQHADQVMFDHLKGLTGRPPW